MKRPETNPRRTRRVPRLAAAAFTLVAACAALGFADARPATDEITIHDAQGRVRISLGVDKHGRASLRLLDAEGRTAFTAVVPEQGGVSVRLDHREQNFRTLMDGERVYVTSSAVDDRGALLKMDGRGILLDGATSSIEVSGNRGETVWSAP